MDQDPPESEQSRNTEPYQRIVTPEELARILVGTLDETLYQTASVLKTYASGIKQGIFPQNELDTIASTAQGLCSDIKQLEQVGAHALNGEPIMLRKVWGPRGVSKEIIVIPTSERT